MAKHRAESETTLTGTVATRGLLTAVAALAAVGGPAAGVALADETPSGTQESYNGADGAAGRDGADGADGKSGQDGKDGKDGQRGEDGKDAGSSTLTPPALGENGLPSADGLTLGGLDNPFTPVLGNDVGT